MGRRVPWGLFLLLAACGTADHRVDPGDLELRDLLGVSPQPASRWSGEQRAAARRVIAAGLDDEVPERRVGSEPLAPFRDELARDAVVTQALARWDDRLADEGLPARALLRVAAPPGMLRATIRATARANAAMAGGGGSGANAAAAEAGDVALQLAPGWNDEPLIELTSRGAAELTALARDAGHSSGPVVVAPAARLVVLAAYLESGGGAAPRLLVNPVLLAALEPGSGEPLGAVADPNDDAEGTDGTDRQGTAAGDGAGGAGGVSRAGGAPAAGPGAMAVGGNPYSFYGSVAECAYAQRLRCDACLVGRTCEPITNISDGNAECEMLAAGTGRGYFLQCINLSLSITAVDVCTADRAPTCPRQRDAASSLATLEANARFLDEEGCKVGLDGCLAKIYGAPETEFPGPGGGDDPPAPPRDINVDCDNSCDDGDNNGNCESSPSCETSGPSCNNSLSCDSTCSNSNDQSGCNGNCNSCNSENSGGGESGCGGECSDSDGGGGGGSSDSGCSSDDSGGGDSGGCGGDSGNSNDGCGGDGCGGGSSSGSGDSCGGDGCGGGSGSSSGDGCGGGSGDSGCGGGSGDSGCGGGSGGGGCGGGSGGSSGSKCSVTPSAPPSKGGRPPPLLSFLVMAMWGLAPIPAAAFARRRALRKAKAAAVPGETADAAEETTEPAATAATAGTAEVTTDEPIAPPADADAPAAAAVTEGGAR